MLTRALSARRLGGGALAAALGVVLATASSSCDSVLGVDKYENGAQALCQFLADCYTIFGECTPLDVIHKIASAPRPHAMSEKPEPSSPINKVTISRK